MTLTLEDLNKIRPVDPEELATARHELQQRREAWKLRELRKKSRLSQAQLAKLLGVGQNRVSQIETGGAERVRLETLRRYATAIGGKLRVEIDVDDERYPIIAA